MDINYWWIGLALLLMVILIIWIIKRNQKDEKEYEDEIIQSEMKPKKHEDDKV